MSSGDTVQKAFESFRNSLESGRVAHGYIVVGPPRSEGHEFALKVLAALYGDGTGRVPNLETHPDIMWMEPQKKSRVFSVDQVKEIRQRLSQTSFSGGWKACVIVGADRLEDASNTLLKTLEEPAGRTIFLLLTEQPEALLPTIASRCQRIVLTNVHDSLPAECRRELAVILAESIAGETLSGIVPAKRVVSMLEGLKKQIEKDVDETSAEGDDDDTVEARASARYRETRAAVLRFIVLWYRDIMLSVFGVDEKCLHNGDFIEQIRRGAAGLACGAALMKVEAAGAMKEQLDRNLDETSVLSIGFYQLVGEK